MTSRQRAIQERHRDSMTLESSAVTRVSTGKWRVGSATTGVFYEVQEDLESCSCLLKCSSCAVCIHMFSCTCPDQMTRQSICKHIHLVRRTTGFCNPAHDVPMRPRVVHQTITMQSTRTSAMDTIRLQDTAKDLTNQLLAR